MKLPNKLYLNYEAYSMPDGHMFRFHAEDDAQARVLMTQHMEESGLESIMVQPLVVLAVAENPIK